MTTNSTFDRNLWAGVPPVDIFVEAIGTLMSSAVPVVDAAAIITSCVGMFLLASRRHFWRPMCDMLSVAYWCSALWIAWSISPLVGSGLCTFAVAKRRSWLLYAKIVIFVVYDGSEPRAIEVDDTKTVSGFSRSIGNRFGISVHHNLTFTFVHKEHGEVELLDDGTFTDGVTYTLNAVATSGPPPGTSPRPLHAGHVQRHLICRL